MGDGRPRGGSHIENERFWDLPKSSLEYIIKDAGEAMRLNPTARKATTGRGNWADQVNDAQTVLGWRKKNSIKEEVELDEATGKEIAAKMMKSKTMKAFAPKVAKMKSVTADDLEKMLPDYVAGGDIAKLFAGYMSNSYKKEGKTATGEKRDEIDLNPKIGEKKER